ncbi:MAG: S41 family peptidase [bacterium]
MIPGFTRVRLIAIGLAFLLALPALLPAQSAPGADQAPQLNKKQQTEIIDSICVALNEYYVFPDVAKQMEKHLRDRLKKGAYDTVSNAAEFGMILTDDMREICHDRHLGAHWFSDEQLAQMPLGDTLTDEEIQREIENGRRANWNFEKLEHLPGNVGYMKFNQFADAEYAGGTAIAALSFLAYVDALIIDLRENGGGSPSMIQLISSYFFDESVHLNSFYIRHEDTVKQFWTQSFVEGPRMADVDIYVLTSSYTFSGAEEFSYNMKNLKRGTIIGETTGGGAHPVSTHVFPKLNFGVRVPFGRAINPISGTNWEGVGVEPDIKVPADQALDRALLEAYNKLLEKGGDPEAQTEIQWAKETLDRKLNPITLDPALLQSYAGRYGPRTITFKDGALIYQREGNSPHKMIPFTNDTFWFDDIDYFRLQVVKNEAGEITHLLGIYRGGRTDISPKGDG